jgi:hypothetical protein
LTASPKQPEEQAVVLDRDRHRRRDHVRAIARDDHVDLVDIEQLGVDPRHRRRIGLVVVIDELNRPAQQTLLGVDVVLPDLHRQQCRLAGAGKPAGQRHAKTDRDRFRRSSCGSGKNAAGYRGRCRQKRHSRRCGCLPWIIAPSLILGCSV